MGRARSETVRRNLPSPSLRADSGPGHRRRVVTHHFASQPKGELDSFVQTASNLAYLFPAVLQLLRDSGLDFTFLLSTLLQPNWDDPNVKPNAIIGETELQKSARPPNARQETMERVAKAAVAIGGPPTAPPSPEMSRPPRNEKRSRVPPTS